MMKQGKKPSRAERKVILSYGLSPLNWLISKKHNGMYTLVHRHTGQVKEIPMDIAVKKIG
ncbi:DUF6906 family protein [Domibacillus aminovorans]|uniref:DUF6906 family protein n=1 Tax=Domibacillus aminovorans TaxID=29332 RepID=UPI0012FE2D94|nr:hypothetical protein [Domibacillus aminovorans]